MDFHGTFRKIKANYEGNSKMSELTKKALSNTLKEMLKEKPVNKITISDLCGRTGIRRQTFYYHFQDLPELIEWTCYVEVESVLKENRNYSSWEAGFLDIFKLAKKEKSFIMNIYHGVSVSLLQDYMCRLTYPLLKHVVDEVAENLKIDDVTQSDKEFIERFYTIAFVDIVISWVDKDMKDDPKEIIDHLSPLIKGTIPNALKAYSVRK